VSYSASVGGHADSKKAEADVVEKFADFVEAAGANGYASFNGQHFSVSSAPAADAVAQLREKVAAYNAEADADDQVAAASPDSDAGSPDPEDTEA
jgi:hypothetical protein